MADIELTELTDLEVVRQDGVKTPASGFSFLVMKSLAKDVNAVGGIDEKPDISGAETVLSLLYKLLESEAREGQVGAHEECDVSILAEAISLIQWFRQNEQRGALEDDGELCKSADGLVFKAHRKFDSGERKSLAAEGKALPDGSYPIPDEDALGRAAVLARSGHGDVAAARRLIAKRAKELGVANPLAEDTKKDSGVIAGSETPAAPEAADDGGDVQKDAVAGQIADAVAKAVQPYEDALNAVKGQLAEVLAKPIPGGPMLAPPRAAQAHRGLVEKAAYHRRQAEITGDREIAQWHKRQAAEIEASLEA